MIENTVIRLQHGVVLFFALLALAVMSIASVALIRGVDTNSLVTGNLVYRQSANTSTAIAFERVAQVMSTIKTVDSHQDIPDVAYYRSCNTFDTVPSNNTCRGEQLTNRQVWETRSRLVPTLSDGNDALTDGIDRFGNTITYVVERMCTYAATETGEETDGAHCMLADGAAEDNNSKGGVGAVAGLFLQGRPSAQAQPVYRITLRILGLKNTVSYVQSFYSN